MNHAFFITFLLLLGGCGEIQLKETAVKRFTFTSSGEDPRVAFIVNGMDELPPEARGRYPRETPTSAVFLYSERPIVNVYLHKGSGLIFAQLSEFTGQGEVWEIPDKAGVVGVRWRDY